MAVYARAVAAGATARSPVQEHEHETAGPRPIRRMLQGDVVDPFGHMWLIGKFLDSNASDGAREGTSDKWLPEGGP
jgi:uncharacterized glyoxalase superfamily protein PhnB